MERGAAPCLDQGWRLLIDGVDDHSYHCDLLYRDEHPPKPGSSSAPPSPLP
jgi:hypothetical protein